MLFKCSEYKGSFFSSFIRPQNDSQEEKNEHNEFEKRCVISFLNLNGKLVNDTFMYYDVITLLLLYIQFMHIPIIYRVSNYNFDRYKSYFSLDVFIIVRNVLISPKKIYIFIVMSS